MPRVKVSPPFNASQLTGTERLAHCRFGGREDAVPQSLHVIPQLVLLPGVWPVEMGIERTGVAANNAYRTCNAIICSGSIFPNMSATSKQKC